jgi:hypothetical protein
MEVARHENDKTRFKRKRKGNVTEFEDVAVRGKSRISELNNKWLKK